MACAGRALKRMPAMASAITLPCSFMCALALTGGKELLKECRNVAAGERVGYDGRCLGDDRGGCSNRKSPDRADNCTLERFIGVGVVDQISCDA